MKRLFFFTMIFIAATLSAQTVLIAKEDTSYKKALVVMLVEKLNAENITTEILDHRKEDLSAVNPADYDVVYVLNSGVMAKVRPDVQEWLNLIAGRDYNVILHTTQRTNWLPQVNVDSITSASRKADLDEITDDIILRIKAKL